MKKITYWNIIATPTFACLILLSFLLIPLQLEAREPLPEPKVGIPRHILSGESGLYPYEVNYSPEWAAWRIKEGYGSGYSKDPHVWVYTSAFADRFGMPEKWVDDSLKGAEALAYRVDWSYRGIKCGYFGEIENCSPQGTCMLDMYIPDAANLPWNTDSLHDSNYGHKSNNFLKGQYKNDKPGYLQRRTKRGNSYPLGLDDVGVYRGKNGENGALGNYTTVEFDRQIYKGLDYISGTMSCGFPDLMKGSEIMFFKPDFDTKTGKRKGYTGPETPEKIKHKVTLPYSFLKRVKTHSEEVYEPSSLWSQLRQRMKSKKTVKQDKSN